MKTATELIRKAYAETKTGDVFCITEVRDILRQFTAWHVLWVLWDERQRTICRHNYTRGRDKLRAYKQSDFTLARRLDRAKARA